MQETSQLLSALPSDESQVIRLAPEFDGNAPDVVTLVHGTFARGANWTRRNSVLARELADAFPSARIQYFDWSGDNSHHARVEAGRQLAAMITEQLIARSNEKHVLVGHSHGGNVMLYAMRDEKVRSAVVACTFLSTPFLHCRERNVKKSMVTLAPMLTWLLLFPGFMPMGLLALHELASGGLQALVDPTGPNYSLMGGLGFVLASVIGGVLVGWYLLLGRRRLRDWLTGPLTDKLQSVARSYVALVKTPPLSCRWLAIHTRGDEALLWLSSLNFISGMPLRIHVLFAALLRRLWPIAVVFAILTTLFTHVSEKDAEYGFTLAFRTLIFPYFIGCSIAIAAYFCAYIVPPAVRGTRIGFGGEGLLANALVSVTPHAGPEQAVETRSGLHQLQLPAGISGLKHSAAYTDSTAIKLVVSFLSGRYNPIAPEPSNLDRLRRRNGRVFWALLVLATTGGLWQLLQEHRRLSDAAPPKDPTTVREKALELKFRRELLSLDKSLPSSSHVDLPFEVGQSFTNEHCHLSGTFQTDVRSVYMQVELDDWFRLTESDIEKMRASKYLSTAQKARLYPMDQASKSHIVSNRYDREGALGFTFDEHPRLVLEYTKLGHLHIGNYKSARAASVKIRIYLDCFKSG